MGIYVSIYVSYLIISYLILSYLILSYLILSYLILSYVILSYLVLSYLIPSSIPCSQDRSRSQDDHIQDHIHHTKGKGQPQPWGQPQPPSCRSTHHGQDRSSQDRSRKSSVHHTKCRGQPQPWGQPQPPSCRSSIPCSQDRSIPVHDHSIHHHTEGRGQPQPWGQPPPHACRSSQDRIHRSILRARIRIPVRILRSRRGKDQQQPLLRLQARRQRWPPGRELRASSCWRWQMSTPHVLCVDTVL